MAPKLVWLSGLKLTHLKNVAVATGINSSGTKTDLSSRLLAELQDVPHSSVKSRINAPAKEQRIISIDMGIRNLAYCVIAVSAPRTPSTASPKPAKNRQQSQILPIVERWTRIAVSSKTLPITTSNAIEDDPAPKVKEAFDPATYAQHAYILVSDLLQSYKPTTVLIERQRYRSMGASAVQEWTLRVNMFEAMIHAVLETFNREGRWSGNVHAIVPNKVGPFWLGNELKPEKNSAAAKKGNKSAKIDLVGKWLEGGQGVELQEQAKGMGQAFLNKWKGKRRALANKKATLEPANGHTVNADIGKLDDLADCLLQGVAWVKWQENKRQLVDRGLDALEELD